MKLLSAEVLDADSPSGTAWVPMLLAFGVSIVAHMVTAFLWPDPLESIRNTKSTLELELTLVAAKAVPVETPSDESVRSEPEVQESALAENPPIPPVTEGQSQLISEWVPAENEPEPSPSSLKLVSPKNWDEVLGAPVEPTMTVSDLPFHPGLRAEVDSVQHATARRELVAMRARVVAD